MITVAQAFSHIRHALGNADPGAPLTLVEIVNAAGHELTGMHTWSWLDRTDTLDLVAGQSYITLPSDFGRLSYVQWSNSAYCIEPADQKTVLDERAIGGNDSFTLKFYVGQSAPTTSSGPVARLEINWPDPATTFLDGLNVTYRARWADVGTDSTACPIPDYMRPLFIDVLRATAIGWEEEESKTERMNRIYTGSTFLAAKRIDDEQQFNYGPIRNGAVRLEDWARNVTYATIETV